MAATKKPRKKYNPGRFAGRTPHLLHSFCQKPYTQKEREQLLLPSRDAVQNIRQGTGNIQHVWVLWYRSRVAVGLIKRYSHIYSEESLAEFQLLERNLFDCFKDERLHMATGVKLPQEVDGLLDDFLTLCESLEDETTRFDHQEIYWTERQYIVQKAKALGFDVFGQ